MNLSNRNSPFFHRAALCSLAVVATVAGAPAYAKRVSAPSADDQQIVQCQLPPQIRSLGNHATYLAAGRRVSTTAADCKIQGGKYDGHGPGELAGAIAPANGVVAVNVGGDKSRAACSKSGLVSGLKAQGGLSVRSGPAATAARVDKLGNGKRLLMCDWSADHAWVGVVYAAPAGTDCGLSKPITQAQPYAGACHSGWVSSKYVKPAS